MPEIEVCEMRGKCPVHKIGDRMVVNYTRIVLEEPDSVCARAQMRLTKKNGHLQILKLKVLDKK